MSHWIALSSFHEPSPWWSSSHCFILASSRTWNSVRCYQIFWTASKTMFLCGAWKQGVPKRYEPRRKKKRIQTWAKRYWSSRTLQSELKSRGGKPQLDQNWKIRSKAHVGFEMNQRGSQSCCRVSLLGATVIFSSNGEIAWDSLPLECAYCKRRRKDKYPQELKKQLCLPYFKARSHLAEDRCPLVLWSIHIARCLHQNTKYDNV